MTGLYPQHATTGEGCEIATNLHKNKTDCEQFAKQSAGERTPMTNTKEDFFEMRLEQDAQSSMLNWWPKIQNLDIPQPRTEYVEVDDGNLRQALEGEAPLKSLPKIVRMVEKFTMPVFLRGTDTSGKHNWENTCYLDNMEQLGQHVANLAEEALMADITTRAIFAREFIPMRLAGFSAFYGNMPVSREIRCFINKGEKICQHWYWFEEAIYSHGSPPKDPDWKEKLKVNNTMTTEDQKTIDGYLAQVCKVFLDNWSVDFCCGADGTWYLIDMARGEISYHHPHEGDSSEAQDGVAAPDRLVETLVESTAPFKELETK